MTIIAAVLRGAARCAILFERLLLKLLAKWMRHQVARLDPSALAASQRQRKN